MKMGRGGRSRVGGILGCSLSQGTNICKLLLKIESLTGMNRSSFLQDFYICLKSKITTNHRHAFMFLRRCVTLSTRCYIIKVLKEDYFLSPFEEFQ